MKEPEVQKENVCIIAQQSLRILSHYIASYACLHVLFTLL
jgi:hypothetical protein